MLRIATDEASTREEAALTSREYTIQRGGGPAAPMTPGSSSNAVPARNHKFDGALALLKRWTLMRYVNTRPAAQVQVRPSQVSLSCLQHAALLEFTEAAATRRSGDRARLLDADTS